jgi:hypothetical protein
MEYTKKYKVYAADSVGGMGNEGKIVLRPVQGGPHVFDSEDEAYSWAQANEELPRRYTEFFILPIYTR